MRASCVQTDIEAERAAGGRLAQTGTQTSPERPAQPPSRLAETGRRSPKSVARSLLASRARIVHDAIACAAFLKFHPALPKQGARVVTRPAPPAAPPRHQRHSVEVSNAGLYLRIHPTTLETLTRSGAEASASRLRKVDFDVPIREEDLPGPSTEPGGGAAARYVVSVLPPAMRALVALWDALADADQLSAATDK
uniref:Uncharacterized protein n=1 Tax=Heliothis virescens TaxID=7102 RepID=A0A2A4J5F0_HELVI